MNTQDFGIFTRADRNGIYAIGEEDGQERLVCAWHATNTVPYVSSMENIGTGFVVYFAESAGKIFLRFEA